MTILVLLSGGVDSVTALYEAKELGNVHALTVHYGQTNDVETGCARWHTSMLQIPHVEILVDLSQLTGSPLLGDSVHTLGEKREHSPWVVPGRNTILATLAAARASTVGASSIWMAANLGDAVGFPDCRPMFYEAMNRTLEAVGFKAHLASPWLECTKAQIVERGEELGVPWVQTWSCYTPVLSKDVDKPSSLRVEVLHCGRCDACVLRREAFEQAGVVDPKKYAADL